MRPRRYGFRRALAAWAALLLLGLTACSMEAPSAELTPVPAAVLAQGAELYAVDCQSCHGGQEGKATGAALRHNQEGDVWRMSDAQIRDVILNGRLGKGMMPTFKFRLDADEVDAVMALIKTWWTPEQRRSQAETTRLEREAAGGKAQEP